MLKVVDLPAAPSLANRPEMIATLIDYVKQEAGSKGELNILEAGCGREWPIKLGDVPYTLTGVDLDQNALDIRKN
jgi:hypothetical protein